MKKICVFCGSSAGNSPKYVEMAKSFGSRIHGAGHGLVYGGASIGVMGALANSILDQGGSVTGVMPQSLMDWEVGHKGLTKLEVVGSMHERKEKMYDYSDAFVAIPGGMGTLDELCEIVTWAQLKYHKKQIFILNYEGFFDNLIAHYRSIVSEGFMSQEHLELMTFVSSEDEFFKKLNL